MNQTVSLQQSVMLDIASLMGDNAAMKKIHAFLQKLKGETAPKPKQLVFPRVPRNRKLSAEVEQMVVGTLPQDFDYETEREKMWTEMAQ